MAADRAPVRAAPRLVAALAAALLVGGAVWAPAPAAGDVVDPHGAELMRLTNLDREALGRPALRVDDTLAAFARDLSFACPTNVSFVLRGRARDMADRGYFDHTVPGCRRADGSTVGALDVMADVLGYRTTRGENIAWNTHGTEASTYAYGCAIDGTGCAGTTPTIATVGVAEQSFMRSSGHRTTILAGFDRFGCGSGVAGDGKRYYACVFSLGGPAAVVAPDAVAPAFGVVSDGGTVRVSTGATVGATVTDNRALRGLEVRLDGRLLRTWTLSGTRATRSTTIPTWRLPVGRHLVRWTARDAAGNARSTSLWLYVR
jgi:uncharacterized protein YkwD